MFSYKDCYDILLVPDNKKKSVLPFSKGGRVIRNEDFSLIINSYEVRVFGCSVTRCFLLFFRFLNCSLNSWQSGDNTNTC